jgi:hypothetical protein
MMNLPRITISLLSLLAAVGAASAQEPASGGVKGKVRDANDRGLAEVSITARRDGGDVAKTVSGPKGDFRITGLKSGRYDFVFEKRGYTGGVKSNVEVIAGDVRDLGGNLVMGVDEGSLVLVRGSIFDQTGRSVGDVKVEMFRTTSDGKLKRLGTQYSNYSGDFAFRQPEGTQTLRFVASYEGQRIAKDLEVSSAGIYRLALTVERKE